MKTKWPYILHKAGLFYLLFIFSFFASCTLEQRRYMPGYHVEWNKNQQANSDKESVNSSGWSVTGGQLSNAAKNGQLSTKMDLSEKPLHKAQVQMVSEKKKQTILFVPNGEYKKHIIKSKEKEYSRCQETKRGIREKSDYELAVQAKKFAIASIACAILILAYPVAFVFAIMAISKGNKVKKKHNKTEIYEGKKEAQFAIACGWAVLVFPLLLIAIAIHEIYTDPF